MSNKSAATTDAMVCHTVVCGVDEAGRGPIAGPVVAAAVVLDPAYPIPGLADSKTLSAAKRSALAEAIVAKATGWAVGWAWPDEIDRLNILNATLLAMRRAVFNIRCSFDCVIVDGKHTPVKSSRYVAVVKADTMILEVQAASIVAKTARDRWMQWWHSIEPEYGFLDHKGYPTADHRRRVAQRGPSRIQRLTFRSG